MPPSPVPSRSERTGDVVAREMASLALSVFGSVRPTEEDTDALANALTLYAVMWINKRFEVGLPNG